MHLALWKTAGSYVVAYFVPIVFIGAFFLLNLTIAVIKSQYSLELQKKKKDGKGGSKKSKKHKKKSHEIEEEEEE